MPPRDVKHAGDVVYNAINIGLAAKQLWVLVEQIPATPNNNTSVWPPRTTTPVSGHPEQHQCLATQNNTSVWPPSTTTTPVSGHPEQQQHQCLAAQNKHMNITILMDHCTNAKFIFTFKLAWHSCYYMPCSCQFNGCLSYCKNEKTEKLSIFIILSVNNHCIAL